MGQVLCIYCIAENVAGENFGEFSYLDYLGEKTLANSLFQINMEMKGFVELREKTLAIGHQFAKFADVSAANVFCCQCFLLYSSYAY